MAKLIRFQPGAAVFAVMDERGNLKPKTKLKTKPKSKTKNEASCGRLVGKLETFRMSQGLLADAKSMDDESALDCKIDWLPPRPLKCGALRPLLHTLWLKRLS